jgi:microcystin-dependent protein
MSGTIPLSMTQQFDVYGKPLAGGQLYLIQAGTVSTPQDGFQDTALSIKMPYPITLDAAGRIPQFFLADGSIKVRLQDKTGVVQLASDNILVIGPSAGGGGGGGTVDQTALMQTGNMILRYGTGVLGGYVRMNGNTIGNSVSGAQELHDPSAQALWIYLYGVDPNLVVSGGRTGNAAADFAAGKQLTLPDWRGCAPRGMDDMGAVGGSAGRLSASYWGGNPTVLNAFGGGEYYTLAWGHMPSHQHNGSGTTGLENAPHNHNYNIPVTGGQKPNSPGSTPYDSMGPGGITGTENQNHAHSFSFTTDLQGGSLPHRTIGPSRVCTFYLKL